MEILTDKEIRLFNQLTVSQQKVYLCLRSKRFKYKKDTFYGRQEDMADYLKINVKTVKRAVKKLKEIGLLTVEKRWKINYYSLPCYDNLEIEAEEPPVVQETDDLELDDTPDVGYWDLFRQIMENGEIMKDIDGLRNIPEAFRTPQTRQVINKVKAYFGAKEQDAVSVVGNLL